MFQARWCPLILFYILLGSSSFAYTHISIDCIPDPFPLGVDWELYYQNVNANWVLYEDYDRSVYRGEPDISPGVNATAWFKLRITDNYGTTFVSEEIKQATYSPDTGAYYIYFLADVSSGNTNYSTPAPPHDLYSSTYSDHIELEWYWLSGGVPLVAYDVWRSTINEPAGAVKIGECTVPTYNDYTAQPSIIYWYWIKARTEYGTSEFSPSQWEVRAPVPKASDFKAVEGVETNILLSWNGFTGLYYRVFRNTVSNLPTATSLTWRVKGMFSYNDGSVMTGQRYYYWVETYYKYYSNFTSAATATWNVIPDITNASIYGEFLYGGASTGLCWVVLTTNGSLPSLNWTLYSIDENSTNLVTIDPVNGEVNPVGPIGVNHSGLKTMDIDRNANLWLSVAGVSNQLYSIDRSTGSSIMRHSISGKFTSISFDTNDIIYAVNEETATAQGTLKKIDTVALTARDVNPGQQTGLLSILGNDIDEDGMLWCSDEWSGRLYHLSKTVGNVSWTGASALVSNPSCCGDMWDLDFDPNGVLRVFTSDYDAGNRYLKTINVLTGGELSRISYPVQSPNMVALSWGPNPNVVVLPGPGSFNFQNLTSDQNYYLFAFLDANGNGAVDLDETTAEYYANPIVFTNTKKSVHLLMDRPAIDLIRTEADLRLEWVAFTGETYDVEYATSLNPSNWTNIYSDILATNIIHSISEPIREDIILFYRVVEQQE